MKKRLLALLLAVGLLLTVLPAALAAPFTDTTNHWAKAEIERWSGYNVLLGDQGKFRPEDPITRAELAAVLDRVVKYIKTSSATFTDVPSGQWYAEYISRLYAAGILNGDGNGQMRPLSNITREEAVALFARAFDVPNGTGTGGFTDASKFSSWAVGPITGMKAAGYVSGDGNGTFRPKDSIKRCEVVRILNSMFPGYANGAASFTGSFAGNALVNARSALTNLTVTGSLYLTEGIGTGAVTLTNVNVTKTLYVRAGTVRLVSGQVSTAVVAAGVTTVTFDVWPNQVILEPKASAVIAGTTYTNNGTANQTLTKPANMVSAVAVTADTTATVSIGNSLTGLTYADFVVKVGSASSTFANATAYTGITATTAGNYFRVTALTGANAGKYTVTLNKALTTGQRVWVDANPSSARLAANPTKQYGVYIKAVDSLVLTSRTDTTAVLNWTAVAGAASVEMHVSSTSQSTGFAKATYTGTLTSSSTAVTVTGLTASRQYWFKLVYTGGGPSKESNVVSTAGADMVTEVLLTGTTAATVTLGSVKTGLTYADFVVKVGSASSTFANATAYIGTTATTSGNYFRVTALTGANAGKYTVTLNKALTTGQRLWVDGDPAASHLSANTAKQYCAYVKPVTDLRVASRNTTTATLQWTAATGASLIEMQVSYTSSTTGFTKATYTSTLTGSSSALTVTGLTASRQYWFRLFFADGGPNRYSNVPNTTGTDIVSEVFVTSSTTATVTLGSPIPGLTVDDFTVKVGAYNSTFANATNYAGTTAATSGNYFRVAQSGSTGSTYIITLNTPLNTTATGKPRLWVDGKSGGDLSPAAGTAQAYCAPPPPLATPTIPPPPGTTVTLNLAAVPGVAARDVEISYTNATTGFTKATYISSPANFATNIAAVATVSVTSGRACWFRLAVTGGGPTTVSGAVSLGNMVSGVRLTDARTATVTLTTSNTGLGLGDFVVKVGAESATFAQLSAYSQSAYTITRIDGTTYTVTLNTAYALTAGQRLWVDGAGALLPSTTKQSAVYIPASYGALTCTGTAGTQAAFTWLPITGATAVELQQSTSPTTGFTKAAYTGTLNAASTGVTVTNLTGGVPYYFRLAFTGVSPGTASNVVGPVQTAAVVTAVTVTDEDTVSVTLSQSSTVTAADFVVKVGPVFNTATVLEGVPAGPLGNQFSVSGSGATYTITLGYSLTTGDKVWVDGAGQLAPNAVPLGDTYVYVAPIENFASTGATKTEIGFSWTAVVGATTVELQMSSVGPTGPFAKAPYGGTLSASATSVTVTGLSAGTTYWFKLVVNNGARESAVLAETTDGYTVTYDANGGTGTVTDPAEYAHGALAAVLSGDTLTPPLPGQVFSGWALEPGGAPVRQPGETIYMTQDFTLYAVWTDAPGP